jgi:hypothetical protein
VALGLQNTPLFHFLSRGRCTFRHHSYSCQSKNNAAPASSMASRTLPAEWPNATICVQFVTHLLKFAICRTFIHGCCFTKFPTHWQHLFSKLQQLQCSLPSVTSARKSAFAERMRKVACYMPLAGGLACCGHRENCIYLRIMLTNNA